ncbi:MAG: sulfatase [Phycisphaerales bacterium]|nr:sulfatase [Phycisphaerales bacterium]
MLCILMALLGLGFQGPDSGIAPGNTSPPNIVVFLVDDMGWQDTSVALGPSETTFNRRYRTPNMARLAERSMVFTNAYSASPVCTPTRTSIMTGQSPGRTGISYWTLHPDRDNSKNHPRLSAPPWRMEGLQEDDPTLAGRLNHAGYRTIHVGKAHLGAVGTSGADPLNLGFDVNIAGHGPGGPGSFYGIHDFKARKRQGKQGESVWDVPGLESYHGKDVYLTEALCDRALDAMESALDDEQPFFLHFAPYAVHAPIMANHRYVQNYPGLDARESAYATMIETMDTALGRVLDSLEEHGVDRETIVIFTSDNGGLSAHARGGPPHVHNAPLRSGKGSAYEGGIRVPLLIAWPGVTDQAERSDLPVISMDLHPTILEMSGVAEPATRVPVDGESLVALLKDGKGPPPDRSLVWHMPHQWGAAGPGIEPFTSIRKDRWKLLYFHDGPRVELYDLSSDLSEQHDLAQDRPAITRQLLLDLDAWFKDTGARISLLKGKGEEVESPASFASRIGADGSGNRLDR